MAAHALHTLVYGGAGRLRLAPTRSSSRYGTVAVLSIINSIPCNPPVAVHEEDEDEDEDEDHDDDHA